MNTVSFPSRDGLNIVGEFDTPTEVDAALVICHAHPQMGGTMKSPLLVALKDAMVSHHYAVLRFNFRGVNGSEGSPSLGTEECADAHGAIDYVAAQLPNVPIAVAGWSFGAAVAVKTAMARHDLSACVAIAPPVRGRDGVTEGLPAAEDVHLEIPLLVVVGSNDVLTPPHDSKAWAEAAGARFAEVPAANHFFWAKYEPAIQAISGFLTEVV